MEDLNQLVEDALNLRNAVSHHGFASNVAARKLMQSDGAAFAAIRERIERDPWSTLHGKAGLNGLLGAFFVLGNSFCVKEMCEVLVEWPRMLVARILAQAPLALRNQMPAREVIEQICLMTNDEDAEIRRWARSFNDWVATKRDNP